MTVHVSCEWSRVALGPAEELPDWRSRFNTNQLVFFAAVPPPTTSEELADSCTLGCLGLRCWYTSAETEKEQVQHQPLGFLCPLSLLPPPLKSSQTVVLLEVWAFDADIHQLRQRRSRFNTNRLVFFALCPYSHHLWRARRQLYSWKSGPSMLINISWDRDITVVRQHVWVHNLTVSTVTTPFLLAKPLRCHVPSVDTVMSLPWACRASSAAFSLLVVATLSVAFVISFLCPYQLALLSVWGMFTEPRNFFPRFICLPVENMDRGNLLFTS